jgi:hypothetical protein
MFAILVKKGEILYNLSMIILCVIQFIIGLGYLSFGYQIAFKGEYNLVRGYKEKRGFALREGIIDLLGGVATLLLIPCSYLWGDVYFFLPIIITSLLFFINKMTRG